MAHASRLPLLDATKVVATQLIVWHHMMLYSTVFDGLRPLAPNVLDWLRGDARIVVQVFLVIAGFLAARGLWSPVGPGDWALGAQLWRRYVRLTRPYVVAVLAAVISAAIARQLMTDEATPAAPTPGQLMAHVALLHDVLGYSGLSAGVWYVAVDFQLFALLATILWTARRLAPRLKLSPSELATGVCGVLTLASLWIFNLDDATDMWAPYFFGAYGLGVMAARIAQCSRSERAQITLALGAVLIAALLLEWRSRIALAGVTALALIWLADAKAPASLRSLLGRIDSACVVPLVRLSYAQFLIHYPVLLLVNACLTHLWPQAPMVHAVGMVATWMLSLVAANALHRQVEQRRGNVAAAFPGTIRRALAGVSLRG